MTILILDLTLPTGLTDSQLSGFLLSSILVKLFVYIGSFTILGTLWIAMHFQIGLLNHTNRPYLWTHILYLMIICIVPLSANLIAAFPHNRITLSFYAINLLCASIAQFIIFQCAHFYKLNDERYNPEIRKAVVGRILIAPLFYLAGLLVAQWQTALGFILLIMPIFIYILPGKVDRFD